MKIINYFKSNLSFIFLFSIILFYTVNNYIWLKLNSPFPTFFYYAFDFRRVIEFYKMLKASRLDLVINWLINIHDAYVYSLTAALIALVFGKSNIINLFNNIPYFAIAVFSIYGIAKKIADRSTALLAVAIFSLYPAVYGTSRLYILEFAIMGMAPLCILCLLNTEEFTNRRYSLLFGLALGWGMLIKYSLIAFIIGPLAYVLTKTLFTNKRSIFNKTTRFSSSILNIGLSALLAIIVMGIKYFNFNNIKSYLLRPLYQANVMGVWYRFDNFRIYTLGLSERQLSFLFFLLLIFGFYGFFAKSERKIITIFLFWIVIPWLILLNMPHPKMTHFIIPYLPAIALISAIGLMHILERNKKFKMIIIGLIITIGIIQYYDFSFGSEHSLSNYKIRIKDKDIHYYLLSDDICGPPKTGEIYNEIISTVARRCDRYGNKVIKLPSIGYSYDSPHVWSCITWFKNLPFEITALDTNMQFIDNVLKGLVEADFILYSDLRNKDIKDPSYLDAVLKKVIKLHGLHFDDKNLVKINQFLEQDSKIFREKFYELINKFELIEKIPYIEDNREFYFYLYKKSLTTRKK